MNEKDSLGDRMKRYENVTRGYLQKKIPVIVRVDGRAFHTFTQHMEKPFSLQFINVMNIAAKALAEEMQGFKLAYVQSDEASFFLGDYDYEKTGAWYDYNINKLVSISAAVMSTQFIIGEFGSRCQLIDYLPVFDSRAFNVPKSDVINYFLWRAKDWKRNSVQMLARKYYSHAQLKNKKHEEMLEMIKAAGDDWNTLDAALKYGRFIYKTGDGYLGFASVNPTYKDFEERWGYLVGEETEITNG